MLAPPVAATLEDACLICERTCLYSKVFYIPIQLRWGHKDGRTVWTEQIDIPVYDGEGRFVAN